LPPNAPATHTHVAAHTAAQPTRSEVISSTQAAAAAPKKIGGKVIIGKGRDVHKEAAAKLDGDEVDEGEW